MPVHTSPPLSQSMPVNISHPLLHSMPEIHHHPVTEYANTYSTSPITEYVNIYRITPVIEYVSITPVTWYANIYTQQHPCHTTPAPEFANKSSFLLQSMPVNHQPFQPGWTLHLHLCERTVASVHGQCQRQERYETHLINMFGSRRLGGINEKL